MKNLMKLILSLIVASMSFSACGGSAEKKQLLAERDSLVDLNKHQRQVLDEMTTAIVEISNILDTINMQEKILFSSHDVEGRRYTPRQVIDNLRTFENILKEKRLRIHYLDSLMNKSNERIRQLSSLVKYLNKELDKKDSIIKVLRADVQSKNYNIRSLNEQITSISSDMEVLSDSLSTVSGKSSEMQGVIEKQAEELYTVYYVIGTKKELTAKGILVGGNLLKKGKINSAAISEANKADARQLSYLDIKGNKPNILTNMPAGSYTLVKVSDDNYRLNITDAKLFWSVNKLLVIQVK